MVCGQNLVFEISFFSFFFFLERNLTVLHILSFISFLLIRHVQNPFDNNGQFVRENIFYNNIEYNINGPVDLEGLNEGGMLFFIKMRTPIEELEIN